MRKDLLASHPSSEGHGDVAISRHVCQSKLGGKFMQITGMNFCESYGQTGWHSRLNYRMNRLIFGERTVRVLDQQEAKFC